MGRAGSFQEGLKHQSPQKEQPKQNPCCSWAGLHQLDFQDASVISDIPQFSQICLPSFSPVCTWSRRAEDRSCSAQMRLLAIQSRRASLGLTYRSKWKWFLPWAAHRDLQPIGEIYSSYPGLFIICETFMTSSFSEDYFGCPSFLCSRSD